MKNWVKNAGAPNYDEKQVNVTLKHGEKPILRIYENQVFGCFAHEQIDASGNHLVDPSEVPQKHAKAEEHQEDIEKYSEE